MKTFRRSAGRSFLFRRHSSTAQHDQAMYSDHPPKCGGRHPRRAGWTGLCASRGLLFRAVTRAVRLHDVPCRGRCPHRPLQILSYISDFHTPQVQSKALVDGESREPSERFSGRLLSFLHRARQFFSFSEKRKKRMGAQKHGRSMVAPKYMKHTRTPPSRAVFVDFIPDRWLRRCAYAPSACGTGR